MTSSQQKAQHLEERTVQFSKDIIAICKKHQNNIVMQPILKQLIRSATSIGANYAEANNASSKQDFRNKIFICKKEAAETKYWLKVLADSLPSGELDLLQHEVTEFVLIFQKIVTTIKNGGATK